MWVFLSELLRLSSHHGTPRATRHCRAAACAGAACLLGTLGACIEQGPLFTDDVGIDAGTAPPLLGAGGSGGGGEPASVPPGSSEEVPRDAGLLPPNEGSPTPGGPAAPPACESIDSGASAGCEQTPPGEDSPGEVSPCDDCLAGVCPAVLERCDDTPGCGAIVACARSNGCEQDECYCGTVNLLLCTTTGQANGPCRDVMLAAPGGHAPTFVDQNAGPASLAASGVGECRVTSDECRTVCGD